MSIRNISSSMEQAAGPPPAAADNAQAVKRLVPDIGSGVALAPEATAEQIQSAVAEVQKVVQMSVSNLEFSIDSDTGKTIVSIIDKSTGDLVRQIPTKEIVEIAKSIGRMQGLLVNNKA